jgi:hypothetical protein
MSSNRRVSLFSALVLVPALACGGETADQPAPEEDAAPIAATEPASVTIVTPAEGAVLESADVEVTLTVTGIEIAPVADGRIGTAHHHLFLDEDVTPSGVMVPQDNPRIVHMGDGRDNHTFAGLEPGEHRVIAVLADLAHVPLDPMVADTVTFRISGE